MTLLSTKPSSVLRDTIANNNHLYRCSNALFKRLMRFRVVISRFTSLQQYCFTHISPAVLSHHTCQPKLKFYIFEQFKLYSYVCTPNQCWSKITINICLDRNVITLWRPWPTAVLSFERHKSSVGQSMLTWQSIPNRSYLRCIITICCFLCKFIFCSYSRLQIILKLSNYCITLTNLKWRIMWKCDHIRFLLN